MNALKDVKIISLILLITLGIGFEGLKRFQIQNPEDQLGKAGEIFSIYRESTRPLEKNKVLRRPKTEIQKISSKRGIKFDLKAAISNYQKEHGLEEHEFGAKKRPDKLKDGDKKKKKKASKYEYVFDKKSGKWIKRRKLTPEQRERLLAKREADRLRAEMLEKMKEKQPENPEDKYNENIYPMNEPVAQDQANPNETQPEEEPKKSYEEWARLLLQHPNPAALNEFVEAYRSSKVSSEIFYRIAEEFANDPRIEMKEQALFIADNFPSLQSFRLAVHILTSHTGDIRTKTEKIIAQDYTGLSGLNVLSRIMKLKDDSTLLYIATQTLSVAIKNLLNPSSEASYASNFTPFISLLTDLTKFEETEVAKQATATLAQLQLRLAPQTIASIDGQ